MAVIKEPGDKGAMSFSSLKASCYLPNPLIFNNAQSINAYKTYPMAKVQEW